MKNVRNFVKDMLQERAVCPEDVSAVGVRKTKTSKNYLKTSKTGCEHSKYVTQFNVAKTFSKPRFGL